MASGTGMAGLAVTAVVSALVAFGVATLLGPGSPPPPHGGDLGLPDTDGLRQEVDRLRREVQELRASRPTAPTPSRAAPLRDPAGAPVAATDGTAVGETDPGEPVPATRAELQAFVDKRLTERLAAGGLNANGTTVQTRKTIDEAGAELGLSSVDLDSVKRVWKDSEQEVTSLLLGTADMEAAREEIKAAKDDPAMKEKLISKVMGNAFRNLGKLATVKDRRKKELKRFLTDEQIKKLDGMNIHDPDEGDMETVFKGTFGD